MRAMVVMVSSSQIIQIPDKSQYIYRNSDPFPIKSINCSSSSLTYLNH